MVAGVSDLTRQAEPIIKLLSPLAEQFAASGYNLYLVGGVVRDVLWGRFEENDDIDLTTDARPEVILSLVRPFASAIWTQGERFGTIGATVEGRPIEITTHRAESYSDGSRKPSVTFGDSLTTDLSRRDFTINAMALRLPDGQFFDPYDGHSDMISKVLATPLSAHVSFTDDPLRMMRAARFIPRFDLRPSPAVSAAASELAGRLDIVSVERIAAELDRLLHLENPIQGFEFLTSAGLLSAAMPELETYKSEEVAEAVQLASLPGSPAVRRAGLLWPLLKRATSLRDGVGEAGASLRRLRYSSEVQDQTIVLLRNVDVVLAGSPTEADVRQLVVSLGLQVEAGGFVASTTEPVFNKKSDYSVLHELWRFGQNVADPVNGFVSDMQNPPGPFFRLVNQLVDQFGSISYAPVLSGQEIIGLLGISPGPTVGKAAGFLRDHWINNGPSTAAEARELLQNWAHSRN